MKIIIFFFLLINFLISPLVLAQELNCRVTVNSEKIQTTNKQLFTNMQKAITEFVNNRRWSEYKMNNTERVDCSFYITISEMTTDNQFKAELQVQAVRPVYNAAYTTTTFNFRDPALDFIYNEYDVLEYNDASTNSNLSTVLAFYSYIILGVDFDSFSLYGGSPFFEVAMSVANKAQSYVETGWKAFDNLNNRYALASAFVDEGLKSYRQMWYIYHRQGLDDMVANAERGRGKITAALPALKEAYSARPTSVIFPLFADTKLDEIINIYSKAPTSEKEEIYKLLLDIYPTRSNRLEALRK